MSHAESQEPDIPGPHDLRSEVDYVALGPLTLYEERLLRAVLADPATYLPALLEEVATHLTQELDPDWARIYQRLRSFLVTRLAP